MNAAPDRPSKSRPYRGWVPPAMFLAAGLLLIIGVGLAQRIGWLTSGGSGEATATGSEAAAIHTCPMHPQIRQPGPGRCPICGMALVPATSSGADMDELAVRIEPAQRRLANIQTSEVKREPVTRTLSTIGSIAIDESRMATIAAYIDGRLERLFADYTGVNVAKGDHLAVIYSPDLFAAQVEYLEASKAVRNSASTVPAVVQVQRKLATNSRRKLVELGMTDEQITELQQSGEAQSRITIYSPIKGTVIEKAAVEGKYVAAGEPIYRVADLSTVWLVLQLYPEDSSQIRYGQRVLAEMNSLPGKRLEGRVAFIDPRVDPQKRTVGVRVEFLNDNGLLRPGDYATAEIFLPIGQQGEVYDEALAGRWISPMHPQVIRDEPGQCPICGMDLVPASRFGYSDQPVAQPSSLYVPRSALLMAGSNSVVYVETEPGRFEIRPVTLGPILDDKVIIVEGLKEDEQVTTNGNFLIDSQMQLAGKPSLIDPTRAIVASRERKQPLQFDEIEITKIEGQAGERLERLFQTYFAIQSTLAKDQKPSEENATRLHQLAAELQDLEEVPESARELIASVREHSEHLHHLSLEKARHDAFRPISHAMVELATLVRSDGADKPYHHMFCPMVKGGAGDWLQADSKLLNPYYGSKMLRCGEVVRKIPPATAPESNSDGGTAVDGGADPSASKESKE